MIKTADDKSWGLKLNSAKLGDEQLEITDPSTQVLIEPMVPYIYLPMRDFEKYQFLVEKAYPF